MRKPNSTLSKALTIIIILFVLFILLVAILIAILQAQKPQGLEVVNVDIATVKDNVYVGEADNGLVKATVSVEVKDGTIQNISILEHDNLLGRPAETIIDNIMEQQSLEVDAVTSATYSSDTIRKAIENALQKGVIK